MYDKQWEMIFVLRFHGYLNLTFNLENINFKVHITLVISYRNTRQCVKDIKAA